MPDDGAPRPAGQRWKTLDKDLGRIGRIEEAAVFVARPRVAPGLALVFVLLAMVVALRMLGLGDTGWVVAAAAALAAYLALNIGANDIANNMGPAVGARAITMGAALALAAVAEVAGALIAGGRVVDTVGNTIVPISAVQDPDTLVRMMTAAMLAAAVWINIATALSAPVSTTHSIIGAILGAGLLAVGPTAVNWPVIAAIVTSWVMSPLLGGIFAALALAFCEARISRAQDRIAAARFWLPILQGVMAGAFAAFLILVLAPDRQGWTLPAGVGAGILVWLASRPHVRIRSAGMENRKKSVKALFAAPLVVAATLLSFAHGANDAANAVGPLAAVIEVMTAVPDTAQVPLWGMAIGGFGIALGLLLFGPKLITVVGTEITKLNPIRAFCVALSTAVTVITASWLGMPVSTTHIAVGSVFGIGLWREQQAARAVREAGTAAGVAPEERARRRLVRRSHLMTVIAAWLVTVPLSALLSAAIYGGLLLIAD